jgi:hypothetical protein
MLEGAALPQDWYAEPDHERELMLLSGGIRTGGLCGERHDFPLGFDCLNVSRLVSRCNRVQRVADVLGDKVCVEGNGGCGSFACGGDHLGARVGDVAGRPDARHARPAADVDADEPVLVELTAEPTDETVVVWVERR